MKALAAFLLAGSFCLVSAQPDPFLGRWDFTIAPQRADWLGIGEKDGALDIWFQPTGGNVYRVKDYKFDGSHLTLQLQSATSKNPGLVWDLDFAGGTLTGMQMHGDDHVALTGVRAPDLKRSPPAAWTDPQPLFNGRNLEGWEPIGTAASHWTVRDGELVNEAHGANLRTTRTFDDFQLHIEVNCPADGNSGIYLRGRYEVQVEYEPLSKNPPERAMGSIYGFLAPAVVLPRKPGQCCLLYTSPKLDVAGSTPVSRSNFSTT